MSSIFAQQVKQLVAPRIAQQFGESVTYTPAGGQAVVITALRFDTSRGEREPNDENLAAHQDVTTGEMLISTDPASATGGIANPVAGDVVVRGGVTYRLSDPPERLDGDLAICPVITVENVEYADGAKERPVR